MNMKNKTRILAALLAAVMLSASSVCVFADETAAETTVTAAADTDAKADAADTADEADAKDDSTAADETADEAKDTAKDEATDETKDETKDDNAAKDDAAAPIVLTVAGDTISVSGAEEGANGVIAGAKAESIGGAAMLPLRAVCEKLGCTVEWYAAERQVVIAKGDSLRTITLDAANMTTLRIIPIVSEDNAMAVNKTVTELTPAPTLIGDLTYVPVAFFEAMGLTVSGAN